MKKMKRWLLVLGILIVFLPVVYPATYTDKTVVCSRDDTNALLEYWEYDCNPGGCVSETMYPYSDWCHGAGDDGQGGTIPYEYIVRASGCNTAGTVTIFPDRQTNLNTINVQCEKGCTQKNGNWVCDCQPCGLNDCGWKTDRGFGCEEGPIYCEAGCAVCDGNALEKPDEECDGNYLDGKTCASFTQYQGGNLACDSNCNFDTSGCYKTCGTGSNEACSGKDGAVCTPAGQELSNPSYPNPEAPFSGLGFPSNTDCSGQKPVCNCATCNLGYEWSDRYETCVTKKASCDPYESTWACFVFSGADNVYSCIGSGANLGKACCSSYPTNYNYNYWVPIEAIP